MNADYKIHEKELMQQDIIKKKVALTGAKPKEVFSSAKIRSAFIMHLIARLCMEIGFFIGLYYLQTYQTNETGVSCISLFICFSLAEARTAILPENLIKAHYEYKLF